MGKNILFISDNVRDYIKLLDNNKNVSTTAMKYTLYDDLCKFIEKIKIFEIIDKKKTLKKLLLHICCSDKYNEFDRKNKLDFFIESLNIIETDKTIKNILIIMRDDLLTMSSKYNKNECKSEIDKLLNKYFKSSKLKQVEISEHNIIKKELLNATESDKELFMKYFNYVECVDDECDDFKITDKYNKNSKINLIKDNSEKILLLELFNGKNVQINMNSEEFSFIEVLYNKFNSFLKEIIKKVSKIYGKKFEEEYGDKSSINENQNGGLSDKDIKMGIDAAKMVFGESTDLILGILAIPVIYFIVFHVMACGGCGGNNTRDMCKSCMKGGINNNTKGGMKGGGFYDIFNILKYKNFNISSSLDFLKSYVYAPTVINDTINNYSGISDIIKNKLKDYLIEKIGEILKTIFSEIINFFKFNKFGGNCANITSLIGGGDDKCFIIPDLKINLINNLLLFPSDDKNFTDFKECDNKNKIDLGNHNYILNTYYKEELIMDNIDNNIDNDMTCLKKTNLFRTNNINKILLWNNINKDLNTNNIIEIPKVLQVLKDSVVFDHNNYQLGGYISDEKINKKFIKTEVFDIKIQYSYQIINVLKKVFLKLKNKNIILEEEKIIQKYIKNLEEYENELSILVKKISNDNINKYNLLLKKSDNIAHKLNKIFINIIEKY